VPFIYVQPADLLFALVGIKIMRLLGAKKLQQSAGAAGAWFITGWLRLVQILAALHCRD